jgi:hypothetical protein
VFVEGAEKEKECGCFVQEDRNKVYVLITFRVMIGKAEKAL